MALISSATNRVTAPDSPVADGTDQLVRVAPYGEVYTAEMLDDGDASAMSGVRYQALATPAAGGTGVAMGIQTAFSDTANIPFIIVNGASAGGKRIIMEYIKFRVTAAGTTTTSAEAAIEIDSTNRYSSGGTSLTPVSCTTEDNTASITSQLRTGAITAAAAGANRKWLWQGIIRKAAAPLWIVNDVVIFRFGNPDPGIPSTDLISSTDVGGTHFVWPVPPAVVGPGGTLLLHIANVANATTPPSLAFECGWKEY